VMLKASERFILPENVPANEFLNLEGQKISTSKNWAVWLHEYLEQFPEQQDVLRYVLTANAPETKDNDFTWEEFQARNNNELVAIFGNFINRVMVLTHKYYEGFVPEPGTLHDEDLKVLASMTELPKKIGDSIENYRFREASQMLMSLARLGNKYLADAEPWKIVKTDPQRVKTIMFTALQVSAGLSILSEPLLPFTASKLAQMLNLELEPLIWEKVGKSDVLLKSKHLLNKAELLFQKIEDAQMDAQRAKLQNAAENNKELQKKISPIKPEIASNQFESLELKVAEIIAAKKIKKTKKLMELTVQLGDEKRTVVSGIAQDYSENELIGKKVTLLVNLKPRTLKGIESQGMILLGEDENGKQVFISPEDSEVQSATPIR
ncbi:methionine--tRNA ligase subunit beta, partial [Flavobacteriaceae bacterium]|nr:methionine--tRNA ligase subunit beta [Flavobacteriaceae bacterium]